MSAIHSHVETNVRRGDTVVVIAGKEKGKKGRCCACCPRSTGW